MINKIGEQNLTVLQAYKTMFMFVYSYYNISGKPPEIGDMLSDCLLNQDSIPVDRAMWSDWINAVEKVLSGKDDKVYLINSKGSSE
jgi:hypothetical protein